jgi:hypothetical protein
MLSLRVPVAAARDSLSVLCRGAVLQNAAASAFADGRTMPWWAGCGVLIDGPPCGAGRHTGAGAA